MNRNAKIIYGAGIPGGMESDDEDDDYYDNYDYDYESAAQPPSYSNGQVQTNGTTVNGMVTSSARSDKLPTEMSSPVAQLIDELRMAVINGSLATVKTIIKEQQDSAVKVDTVLKPGWTSLMYACSFGHQDVTEFLLQEGANSNYHHDEFTPLMATCASSKNVERNLLKCVQCLIAHGANVNAQEKHQMTPLMFAVKNNRLEIIKHLLENEIHLDMVDNQGWTALHWSVSSHYIDAVRLLLRANPTVVEVNGQSITEFANEHGTEMISELLKEYITSKNVLEDAELCRSSKEKSISFSFEPEHKFSTYLHGDLEIFLSGLALRNLIPVFHAHELKYKDVLQLTDTDLLKIGIDKLGWRKSILEGIRMVHRKEWQEASLENLKEKSFISCPDACCMMANIEKHLTYIQATSAYLRQHIQGTPRILEIGQESNDVRDLLKNTESAMNANRELDCELCCLQRHLDQIQKNCEYVPADLIQVKSKAESGSMLKKLFRKSALIYLSVVFAVTICGVTVCTKIAKI